MNYKISVITVCLNSEKTIENALRSVLVQDYSSVEYIVIDGCSSDNTNVIVSDYEKDFVERGYDFIHLIEKDTGIFDAMNKGITIATGDWIIFLNSDDSFFDSHVLSQVFNLWRCDVYHRRTKKLSESLSYRCDYIQKPICTSGIICEKKCNREI